MEQQPLVSVIINCYNGEKYLREAIDSVIAQTYTNWELIFWDNQSTDGTAEIVKSYKDDRIRYFYAPEHTPLGEARNLAMKETKGEYICFLDADDLWVNTKIELELLTFRKDSSIGVVYTNYLTYGDCKPKEFGGEQGYRDTNSIMCDYDIGMSSAMILKDVIVNRNITFNCKFQLVEDFDFFIEVSRYTKLFHVRDCLVYNRIHGANLTYRSRNWHGEFLELYNKYSNAFSTDELIRNTQGLNKLLEEMENWIFLDNLNSNRRLKALLTLPKKKGLIYFLKCILKVCLGPNLLNKVVSLTKHHDSDI